MTGNEAPLQDLGEGPRARYVPDPGNADTLADVHAEGGGPGREPELLAGGPHPHGTVQAPGQVRRQLPLRRLRAKPADLNALDLDAVGDQVAEGVDLIEFEAS